MKNTKKTNRQYYIRHSLRIPANLNLEQLIKEHKPQGAKGWGINMDNLAYILDCIIYHGIIYKEDYYENNNRYVPLKTEYLKNMVSDYKNCIKFLMDNGIIERSSNYIPNKRSYGYRISSQYLGDGWVKAQIGNTMKKKITQQKKAQEQATPIIKGLAERRKHLIDFLKSPKFQIDTEAALRELELYPERQYLKKQRQMAEKKEKFNTKEVVDEINQTMNNFKHLIEIINTKEFDVIIDESGHRLHSPLARLPKFLRKYLTYDGQPLVSIDLKNSQPFFSLLLLDEEFYKDKTNPYSLINVNDELYKKLCKVVSRCNKCLSIMMQKILETLAGKELDESFKLYENDVLSGNIYDRFLDIDKANPLYDEKRGEMKGNFFHAIFSPPKRTDDKAVFYDTYSLPFKIFNMPKQANKPPTSKNKATKAERKWYGILATTLQRIESMLILDTVCKRIELNHPEIPLFTVHDSIATTPQYAAYVEQMMRLVLHEFTGYIPALASECWCEEQLPQAA